MLRDAAVPEDGLRQQKEATTTRTPTVTDLIQRRQGQGCTLLQRGCAIRQAGSACKQVDGGWFEFGATGAAIGKGGNGR